MYKPVIITELTLSETLRVATKVKFRLKKIHSNIGRVRKFIVSCHSWLQILLAIEEATYQLNLIWAHWSLLHYKGLFIATRTVNIVFTKTSQCLKNFTCIFKNEFSNLKSNSNRLALRSQMGRLRDFRFLCGFRYLYLSLSRFLL